MSKFFEYIKNKNTSLWINEVFKQAHTIVEMAVLGDAAKTPILFDWDDIKYLYQFPPMFWRAALSKRYNEFLLRAKQAEEKGGTFPDRQQVTFKRGRGTWTFNVDTGVNKLLKKLEADRDDEFLSGSELDQRDQYKGGHYGYDISNPTFHPQDEEQNAANGYVGMTKKTATLALADWRKALQGGWLGNIDKFPKAEVSFGGGKGGAAHMPVLTGQTLAKIVPENKIANDHKVIWTYINDKGEKGTTKSYLPLLLPGKVIPTKYLNQHKELMDAAKEAKQNGDVEKANNLIAQAKQIQQEAPKYSPYDWNVHRYSTIEDPNNPKGRKYKRLHSNAMRFGGFHPNAQQAEKLVGGEDIWKAIEPYVVDRNGNDQVLAIDENGDQYYKKRTPIEAGVARFLNTVKGSYEFPILNTMFDDITQEATLELVKQVREPIVMRFVKALKEGNEEELGKLYPKMAKKISNNAFNFAQRVSQLDWGRGTRRLRKPATEGVVSIYDELSKAEGSRADILDLARGLANRISAQGGPDGPKAGQRKYRSAGGLFGKEEIYFGHTIKNLMDNIKELEGELSQAKSSGHGKTALQKDAKIRQAYFQTLWSLYIATRIKFGQPWTIESANKWADSKLQLALKSKGMKVTSAPEDLLQDSPQSARKAKTISANQEADKAEIMAAVGRESEVSSPADKAEKELFNPATIEYLKSDPEALQSAMDAIKDVKDKGEREKMQAILNRIKAEMEGGSEAPQRVAAKTQSPDAVTKKPIGAPPNVDINTQKLVSKLVNDPKEFERLKNTPQIMNDPKWQQVIANVDDIIKSRKLGMYD